MNRTFQLQFLSQTLSVYRFSADVPIPSKVWSSDFVSVSKSANELSIVVCDSTLLEGGERSPNWRAFYIDEQLAHDELGILAHISTVLATAECSIFAISTYDTDYILIPSDKIDLAKNTLMKTGRYSF